MVAAGLQAARGGHAISRSAPQRDADVRPGSCAVTSLPIRAMDSLLLLNALPAAVHAQFEYSTKGASSRSRAIPVPAVR